MSVKPPIHQTPFSRRYEFAAVTADTTARLAKMFHDCEIDRVDLYIAAGLAASATDYFAIQVKNGSTVVASWSTLDSAEGTITADTYATMTLATSPDDRRFAKDDVMTLLLDETGTASLPVGHIIVHGRERS